MAEIQEIKKSSVMNNKLKVSSGIKDSIILGCIVILVFILSYSFNTFIFFIKIFKENPKAINYIDEIISVLLTLSIGLAIFSWRRWLELKKETAERLRQAEELREVAETKADVERIISKQLRSDMDQIKHEVADILHLLRKNPYSHLPNHK